MQFLFPGLHATSTALPSGGGLTADGNADAWSTGFTRRRPVSAMTPGEFCLPSAVDHNAESFNFASGSRLISNTGYLIPQSRQIVLP